MSIKIGITGGIGSGKSVVSRLFELMGIPVYISDKESKRLTVFDPCIREKLMTVFGEEIYRNGELNKPLLASYLFENPDKTKTINNIIHPRVREDFQRWAAEHSCYPALAIESAVLIESGFTQEVDVILQVYAPEELRLERVMKRNSFSRELIVKRMRSQMCDEEKMKLADYIIINDDETPLIPQVEFTLTKERLFPNLL
ncbi:Dephospho-CoA kinase [termite gut metagenome]|uniref:Dephospho-CoA kinase n=1 Tax=termite gut metagenome TaxID=433724 RepID=A0A5J4QN54_9ZZZZ